MSVLTLVWSYLKARPLNTAINMVLLSLGIAVIVILLVFNKQLEEKITSNSRGIDLVVGAKGSPLQLILCSIFHIDFPTGNINLAEAEKLAKNRLIKKAIPLALGDSYQAFRIVGTTQDYAALYHATVQQGVLWKKNLEVTIGSQVASGARLKVGDTFASAHGLTAGGHQHNEHNYVVVGIFNPTHSVLDKLILTNVESIWEMHEEGEEEAHETHIAADTSFVPSPLIPSIPRGDSTKEITSMIIQYRGPMAVIQLPRLVNSQSSFQAASPPFETARLFSILGVGMEILMSFAYVLIVISGLSIFIALYNSLKERRYDLAIMRSMGASRTKLVVTILLEGAVLTLSGTILGLILGHGAIALLAMSVRDMQNAGISGFIFYSAEWIILSASLLLGLVCSVIPAVQAYRTDISRVLSGG
jgi:putative ABC transport system permease protein